jgi:hypothetical protein
MRTTLLFDRGNCHELNWYFSLDQTLQGSLYPSPEKDKVGHFQGSTSVSFLKKYIKRLHVRKVSLRWRFLEVSERCK